MRTFEDKPAIRESVPLLVGLVGPSGSGKTYSALRLATGIRQVTGGEIYGIDTEARRMLHYADKFQFRHLEFKAPFGPMDYLAAIEHCVAKGARVIVIDSMSHEHEGPGGVLEMHEAEMERLGGSERMKFLAWQKPKSERRRMLNTILQMPVNFVFCFRAKEKMKLERGKDPQQLGFMPIAGEELVFEMTANCLLLPNSKGAPCWETEYNGERLMMKLPGQFETLLKARKSLDEDTGRIMAEWARGVQTAPLAMEDSPTDWDAWSLEERGLNRASLGTDALSKWWATLSAADKKALKPKLDNEWKQIAANAGKTP
jgi:energy-coupling factor transporter ATP-binding protein EcfA2